MVDVQVSKVQTWKQLAQQLRVDSIRCTTAAGSGHPSSSMSAADLMAVLMAKYLRYDFDNPHHPNNDHLVFSKGHASPLLYSMYKAAGAIKDEELLSLRKFGSRLEGHPVPVVLPWVDVATGSLGQGLPMGVGMALDGKYLDKLPFRVWVLLGDSETAEGSVWEAFATAGHYKLNNLIAIIDMNRLGQRGETALGWDSKTYAARVTAFGCHAIEIDGHNLEAIDKAFEEATKVTDRPTVIIAKTQKGAGVDFIANHDKWHGKALSKEEMQKAIQELGGEVNLTIKVQAPEDKKPEKGKSGKFEAPQYSKPTATREAYGDALKALGAARPDVVVVDAEVSNSTYAEKFRDAYPDRFFEMYIAEQQMVGAAIGLATRDKVPFASTFAAFLTRAYDFIRMGAVSRANIRLSGSHAGVSIGQDGPSQMALEDLAMMRAVYGSTVLYPSDATCAAHLVGMMADRKGISYMRTTREKTAILYDAKEKFEIGGSKVLRRSGQDKATLIGAGITLHECLKAHEQLQQNGINVRVIDLYSVKPIDTKTLHEAAKETPILIVVEDHWPEGGLGDAVLEAFAGQTQNLPRVIKLAVNNMPGSGTPEELIEAAGISAKTIVETVRKSV
jgi:transketolase